jgi:DNA-binding CsgD family transcriptional regulator
MAKRSTLIACLSAGRSTDEIVMDRGVSRNRVRTQLAAILRKAGTTSQRDLVSLLSLLPALHAAWPSK